MLEMLANRTTRCKCAKHVQVLLGEVTLGPEMTLTSGAFRWPRLIHEHLLGPRAPPLVLLLMRTLLTLTPPPALLLSLTLS